MNWKHFFSLRGTNLWIVGSSVGLNVFWAFASFWVAYFALRGSPNLAVVTQMGLMVSIFAGAFFSGWFMGWFAADRRGPTYGMIGSLGSALLTLVILVPTGGVFGLLVAVVALAGGLNGGLFSLTRPPRK